MSQLSDAINALKAALTDASEAAKKPVVTPDVVELAMIDGIPEALWELLHPKGLDGKFIKKGSAAYVYGYTKTATYTNTTLGKKVSVPLEPGDSLYTNKSGGSFYLKKADGSGGLLNIEGKIGVPTSNSDWIDQKVVDGNFSLIDSSPGFTVAAPTKEAVEALATPLVLNALETVAKEDPAYTSPKLEEAGTATPDAPVPDDTPWEHPNNPPAAIEIGNLAVTTKAGPPYGPGVWITPGLTDQYGKPYLMSGQGEKSTYEVYESSATPAEVTSSKGVVVNGLEGTLVGKFDNKKSAKAWLSTNAFSVVTDTTPVPEDISVPETDLPVKTWPIPEAVLYDPFTEDVYSYTDAYGADGVAPDAYLVASPDLSEGTYFYKSGKGWESEEAFGALYGAKNLDAGWAKEHEHTAPLNESVPIPVDDSLADWEKEVAATQPKFDSAGVPTLVDYSPEDTVYKSGWSVVVVHPDGSGQYYDSMNDWSTLSSNEAALPTIVSLALTGKTYKVAYAPSTTVNPDALDNNGIPNAIEYTPNDTVAKSDGGTAYVVTSDDFESGSFWWKGFSSDKWQSEAAEEGTLQDYQNAGNFVHVPESPDPEPLTEADAAMVAALEAGKAVYQHTTKDAVFILDEGATAEDPYGTLYESGYPPNTILPGVVSSTALKNFYTKISADPVPETSAADTAIIAEAVNNGQAVYKHNTSPHGAFVIMDKTGNGGTLHFGEGSGEAALHIEDVVLATSNADVYTPYFIPSTPVTVNFTKDKDATSAPGNIAWLSVGVTNALGNPYSITSSKGSYYILHEDGTKEFSKAKDAKAWLAENAFSVKVAAPVTASVTPHAEVVEDLSQPVDTAEVSVDPWQIDPVQLPTVGEVKDYTSVDVEEPSKSNPTPGSPESGPVKVKGFKGVLGSYTTIKHKDPEGFPYFITSNGKSNNWEVHLLGNVGTFSDETGKWSFKEGTKALGKYKTLKAAKGAIAGGGLGSKEDKFSKDPATGHHSLWGDEASYVTAHAGLPIWVKETDSGVKQWYVGHFINGYAGTLWNGSALSNNVMTDSNLASWDKVYDPSEDYYNMDAFAPKALGFEADEAFASQIKSVTNFPGFVNNFPSVNVKIPYSSYAKITSSTEVKDAYKSSVATIKGALPKHQAWLDQVNKAHAAGSLTDKERTMLVQASATYTAAYRTMTDLLAGDTPDTADVYALQSFVPNALGNVAYNSNFNSLSTNVKWNGKMVMAFAKAKAMGFEVNEKSDSGGDAEDIGDGMTFPLENQDDVAKVQAIASDLGLPWAGAINNLQIAKTWLAAYLSGDPNKMQNASATLAGNWQSVKMAKSLKDWVETNVAPEDVKSEWTVKSLADHITSMFGSVQAHVFDPKAANVVVTPAKRYAFNNETWRFSAADNLFHEGPVSSPTTITPQKMQILHALGVAKPLSNLSASYSGAAEDNGFITKATPQYTSLSSTGGALWTVSAEQTAELMATGYGSEYVTAITSSSPIMHGLLPVTDNPYADLAEDQNVMSALFHSAMEHPSLADWILSDGESAPAYADLVSAFGFNGGVTSTVEEAAKSFVTRALLPKMQEQAAKYVSNKPQAADYLANKAVAPKSGVTKPEGVNDEAWGLALAVMQKQAVGLFGNPGSDAFYNSFKGNTPDFMLTDAPKEEISAAMSFAQKMSNSGNYDYAGLGNALQHLAKSGVWGPKTTQVVATNGSGHKIPLALLPGDKVYDMSGYWPYNQVTVVHLGGKTGYTASSSGAYASLTEHVANAEDHFKTQPVLLSNPINMDYSFLKEQKPDTMITEAEFALFHGNFDKDFPSASLPGMNSLTVGDSLLAVKAMAKQKPDLYEWVTDMGGVATLPKGVLKTLHYGIVNGTDKFATLGKFYADYQIFAAPNDEPWWLKEVSATASFQPQFLKGHLTEQQVHDYWSGQQVQDAYLYFFGQAYTSQGLTMTQAETKIAEYIESQGGSADPSVKGKKTGNQPVLHAASFSVGGMHSKGSWVDEDGNKWISKAFKSDPNSKLRIEAEHYAMRIGDLHGFNPPASVLMKVPSGDLAYAQHLADAKGDFRDYGWNDLPESAMTEAMTQHIFDWVISNHDSHPGNIMLTEDGLHAFPIDRGQAFRFFPQDKLQPGYLPPSNPEAVWYDLVYNAVSSGQMSKDQADRVRDAVLRKAALVSTRNNDAHREYLVKALASRTEFPSKFADRDAFIDALMERKANTFNDFTKLWEGLYKNAGYDYDASKSIDAWLPKMLGNAHVAVTPELVDNIMASKALGVPLFFAGDELDNGHMQFYTSNSKNGNSITLRMEARMRPETDVLLGEWLAQQTVVKGSGAIYKNTSTPTVAQPPVVDKAALPGLANAFNHLTQYIITVGSHIKKGDYEYNKSTVASAKESQANLQNIVDEVEAHVANSHTLFPDNILSDGKFVTTEQQDAWLVHAKAMLENFALVDEAVDTKVAVSKAHPNAVPFTMPTYSPSAGLVLNFEAKDPSKAVELSGETFMHYKDGNYVKKNADGALSKIDKDSYIAALNTTGAKDVTADYKTPEPAVVKAFKYAGHTFIKYDDDTVLWKKANGSEQVTNWNFAKTYEKDGEDVTKDYLPKDGSEEDVAPVEEEEQIVTAGTKILKITHKPASAFKGHFDPDTTVLTETGVEHDNLIVGSEYMIEFEGITIKYQAAKDVPGKAYGQQRLMRVEVADWDGTTQKIDALLSALRSMGLTLGEADEKSMELMYWRTLYGTLKKRKTLTAEKQVISTVSAAVSKGMNPDEELSVYRTAFSKYYSEDVVAKVKAENRYLPSISKTVYGSRGGRPYWEHPDQDYKALKTATEGRMYSQSITYGGQTEHSVAIAKSGFALSTEERLRVLGRGLSGASSGTDQVSHGSSQFIFTRMTSPESWSIVWEPKVAFRLGQYTLHGDQYGEADNKDQSAFNPVKQAAKAHKDDTEGETMMKDALSVMDDMAYMVVGSDDYRNQIIKHFKEVLGITEIRGIPVEERFVKNAYDGSATEQKIWDYWTQRQDSGNLWKEDAA